MRPVAPSPLLSLSPSITILLYDDILHSERERIKSLFENIRVHVLASFPSLFSSASLVSFLISPSTTLFLFSSLYQTLCPSPSSLPIFLPHTLTLSPSLSSPSFSFFIREASIIMHEDFMEAINVVAAKKKGSLDYYA